MKTGKKIQADETYRELWIDVEVAVVAGCPKNAAIYAARLANHCAEPCGCENHGPDCIGVTE